MSVKTAVLASTLALLCVTNGFSQKRDRMTRLAKLQIDSAQLSAYNVFLKEEIEASLQLEPGVLTLFAVAEKANPNHITIFEIYVDKAAYEKHIRSPHFLKYKTETKAMVKELELVEVVPLLEGQIIKR